MLQRSWWKVVIAVISAGLAIAGGAGGWSAVGPMTVTPIHAASAHVVTDTGDSNTCSPGGMEAHVRQGLTIFDCNDYSGNGHGQNTVWQFGVQAANAVESQEMVAMWWEAQESGKFVVFHYDTTATATGCGGASCRLINNM